MKFRKGDIVSVRGIVRHNCDDDEVTVAIELPGNYGQTSWVDLSEATMKEPFLVVGDDVWWGPTNETQVGTILAIANGHLWLDLGGGDYCTRRASTVGRVDPKKEGADAEAS